jgi:hypothetical protein
MRKSKSDWRAIVTSFKTSGQRQTEWCQANNIKLSNLRYWLQKEKKMEPASEKKASMASGRFKHAGTHRRKTIPNLTNRTSAAHGLSGLRPAITNQCCPGHYHHMLSHTGFEKVYLACMALPTCVNPSMDWRRWYKKDSR